MAETSGNNGNDRSSLKFQGFLDRLDGWGDLLNENSLNLPDKSSMASSSRTIKEQQGTSKFAPEKILNYTGMGYPSLSHDEAVPDATSEKELGTDANARESPLISIQESKVAKEASKESVQAVMNRRNEAKESVEDLASRAVSHFSSKHTKNIVVPKSAYEFEVSWKALSDDCHMQAHLLKMISPTSLPQIFKNSLSASILVDIVKCTSTFFREETELAIAILDNLMKDIVMYVNSPGGSVTAGMAVFDTMKHIRADVSTVCIGLAASMSAFILSAGTKGKRYSLPNARIMIHQPLGGVQGSTTDMEIQVNEVVHHHAVLSGYLAYFTGHPVEKIVSDTDKDFFMSAKEAKEYGLIDDVITNPLKALQPQPVSN